MLNRDRLIVALDVSSATQARQIVQSIGESASTYKIGKQLFTAEGPQIVRDLVSSGRKVFLDLKFHDIPNTVAGAVAEAAKLGVSMLTVHASGGSKMLKAAAEAAAQSAYQADGSGGNGADQPVGCRPGGTRRLRPRSDPGASTRLARPRRRMRRTGRLRLETRELRRELGHDFAIVTPGIRPAWPTFARSWQMWGSTRPDDQARVLTPKEAIAAGATYLVVGRPILEAADPAQAAAAIVSEIGEVVAG